MAKTYLTVNSSMFQKVNILDLTPQYVLGSNLPEISISTSAVKDPANQKQCNINSVATAQGKQGIWFLLFPDRENTGYFVVTQRKVLRLLQEIFFDCIH